jgi:nucleoside transporter
MSNTADAASLDYRTAPATARGTNWNTFILLSLMMFLQYAVWGLWLLPLPKYLGAAPDMGGLGFTKGQVGWIMALAGAFGAFTAPFIAGQLADRYLNAEKTLGIMLLVGGAVNFLLAYTQSFGPFLLLSIVYSILYMPTLSLTNSVSFQNLDDPAKQFPPIRMFGTIGWAVAAGVFPYLWLNAADERVNTARIADALRVSGVLSIIYAMYCFFLLPKTPPKPSSEPLAFAKAFRLFRHPGFLVISVMALPVAIIHMAFFFRFFTYLTDAVKIPSKWAGFATSIGQYSELFFLAILGVLLKRIGFKAVMIIGVIGFAVRFGIFSLIEPAWLMALAQSLHGLCYAFFYAAAYIYVETVAPPDVRHSAQTVFGMLILGVGPVLAGLYNQYMPADYATFWRIEAGIAVVVALVLMVAFKEHISRPRTEADGDMVPPVEAEPLPPGQ